MTECQGFPSKGLLVSTSSSSSALASLVPTGGQGHSSRPHGQSHGGMLAHNAHESQHHHPIHSHRPVLHLNSANNNNNNDNDEGISYDQRRLSRDRDTPAVSHASHVSTTVKYSSQFSQNQNSHHQNQSKQNSAETMTLSCGTNNSKVLGTNRAEAGRSSPSNGQTEKQRYCSNSNNSGNNDSHRTDNRTSSAPSTNHVDESGVWNISAIKEEEFDSLAVYLVPDAVPVSQDANHAEETLPRNLCLKPSAVLSDVSLILFVHLWLEYV